VAVFDIEARNVGLAADKLDDLTDYLCSLLAQNGYQVVPRARLRESLLEKKKESYRQCYDEGCQIEIGRELAAQKSASTQVRELGGECKVTLTLFDLRKSTSEGAGVASGGCKEPEIVKSLEEAVARLVGSGAGAASPSPAPVPPASHPPKLAGVTPAAAEKAGLLWIGSTPAGIDLTRTEVTVAQYRACVEAGKCSAPKAADADNKCNWGAPDRGNHPVNCVGYDQAAAFCGWVGGRLPTEAEWYAEATYGDTRQFPWGDERPTCDLAVMEDKKGCGRDSTWPVCSKPKGHSVSGLCDMSGNVFEWLVSSDKDTRVFRGGSWTMRLYPSVSMRVLDIHAENRGNDVGFCCGRPFGPTSPPPAPLPKAAAAPIVTVEQARLVWLRSAPAGLDFTRSEVTVAQYRVCMQAGTCSAPMFSKDIDKGCNLDYPDRAEHPMNCVNWSQANDFCAWAGGRLPTEAEWEAEATNKGTRRFPWGAQAPSCEVAVMKQGGEGCGRDSTWPVCSKPKGHSVSGLCDMLGNVWEWMGPPEDRVRRVRGHAWYSEIADDMFATSIGLSYAPDLTDGNSHGFRCVRAPR